MDLIEWVRFNKLILRKQIITCTGTTGKLVEDELNSSVFGHLFSEKHQLRLKDYSEYLNREI